MEMTKTKMVTKKRKCRKGYSCGSSCINVKLECRKGLTGQSVDIADRLANLLAAAKTEKPKTSTKQANSSFTINPQKPEGDIDVLKSGKIREIRPGAVGIMSKVNTADGWIRVDTWTSENPNGWNVLFKVNNKFDAIKKPNLTKEDRKLISKTVNYDMQRLLQLIPDKATIFNEPHDTDGKQEARARLYERYGFGKLQNNGEQYAVKNGNTISPKL